MNHTITVSVEALLARVADPSRRGNLMLSKTAGVLFFAALSLGAVRPADAQYFGRNKVQYEKFDWRILKSDHFDLYFYPSESLKVADAGRQSERWYSRLSDIFRHQFDRKSLVFYADHPDFQQTNVIGEQAQEGTGGVTEGQRTRVIMPWTGIYKDDEHVLGHELVHVFQYNIAETAPGQGGIARLNVLPLWLVEGMAEYFSLGRHDEHTAMWMRDAVMRDKFPTIKQLTTDPRFFPYRYGQALWAYIGGRWGDRAVVDVYRTALRIGWDQALIRSLGLTSDSLSKDWAAANKAFYASQIASRTHPDSAGTKVIKSKENSEYNVSPALSADGKNLAFFTTKTNLFGIDLVMADAATGKIIRRLAGPQSDGHFDAISFINSSGAFSPDGARFAFIVYNQGDNQISVVRTSNGKIERNYSPKNIGAVYNLAWSPDGRHLAFTGSNGGISDLYLMDVESGTTRQLTNDRFADIQPTFSPDGRTLAFVTDRGDGTDWEKLTFGELRLATIDIASGQVTARPTFARGKTLNPQYSPDGTNLYFVANQDGVSDLYRMELASNQIYRITKLATGVSGITGISPSITVAAKTGTLIYTVFRNQGHELITMEPSRLTGELVDVAAAATIASAATLPPGDVAGTMSVAAYLNDPLSGLASSADMIVKEYNPSFALDALGQPSVGVATGPFGTGVAGGVYAIWGDQLSDQAIFSALSANGQVKDFGGALYYQNLKRRWNWLAGFEHSPYLSGGSFVDYSSSGSGACVSVCYYQILQRIYQTSTQFSLQYPFSSTKRLEFGAGITRYAWEQQLDSLIYDNTGTTLLGRGTSYESPRAPLHFAQTTLALVGDNAFGAFTSPIAGRRYRFEVAPTIGTVRFTSARADYRRYYFNRPFTFAIRGLHYGRYGRDADNPDQLQPMYLGDETLIRGYGYTSIGLAECAAGGNTSTTCPVFERLFGSRLAVANVELRIPVFGTSSFGLINFPYLPLEVSPFFDAGLAWTKDQKPDLRYSPYGNDTPNCTVGTSQSYMPCAQRIPVLSTGVSFRFNVLGYMILETYIAKPFQRPTKKYVWGISLAPGW
jgi:dipeptidyl aminopeptidase/acylaminoacyl peptidase